MESRAPRSSCNLTAFARSISVTVAPFTTEFIEDGDDLRVEITPSEANGLRQTSYIMIDKIGTIRRTKCGPGIGHLSDQDMDRVNRALAVFLGFA